ncbi:MAG: hypothetical protein NTW11_01005 [Candidatus Staskawiczbacteria bacterium]|nr:hypothetical protein [Candidatus Staskawiczbacteria bacterium]
MDTDNNKIKEARKIEKAINENLFILCAIVTLATMTLMVANFFARGGFLPTRIGFFYLAVVLIYSFHKEFLRWLGQKNENKNGEYFVYAWVVLTTILYMVSFFSNGYFDHSKEGNEISTVADAAFVTLQVLGVFVATRIMKIFFMFKK